MVVFWSFVVVVVVAIIFRHIALIFLAILCLLKARGICGEEIWVRTDLELKAHVLLPSIHIHIWFSVIFISTYLLLLKFFFLKDFEFQGFKQFLISSTCPKNCILPAHGGINSRTPGRNQMNLWHSEETDTC